MRITDPQQPVVKRVSVGDTGEFMSMGQFAEMIRQAGGKVVQFVDERRGVNLNEADIEAMVKEEADGRSNQA